MYNELFEAWRKEKENPGIQPLPEGFYTRLTEYVKKIRQEKRMLDEKTVKGKLLQKEEENVGKMTQDLIQTRYEKIMILATDGEVPPATTLSEEEDDIYKGVFSQAGSHIAFAKNILQGRLLKEKKTMPEGLMIVRFLKEIPQIIGADMRTYGPFKVDDVGTVPEKNAKILIKQGAAAEIET